MLALFSSRLRTWILLAVAVPAVRGIVGRLRRRAERRKPDAATAKALRTADSVLARVDRRAKKRSRRNNG